MEFRETFKKDLKKVVFIPIIAIFATAAFGAVGAYWYTTERQAQEQAASDAAATAENTTEETAATETGDYAGWLTYNNAEVGYTLRYPEGWTITEVSEMSETIQAEVRNIMMVSPSGNHFSFGLGRTGATYSLSERTGIGAGELTPLTETTTLLGAEIVPEALVYESKTKEYIYSMSTAEKAVCDCIVAAWFSPDSSGDYEDVSMDQTELPTVNLILTSVAWLSEGSDTSLDKAQDVAENFLDARQARDINLAEPYVTAEWLANNTQVSFAGASSPSLGSYDNLSVEYLTATNLYRVTVTTHWFLQGAESGTETWTLNIVHEDGSFLVDEVSVL